MIKQIPEPVFRNITALAAEVEDIILPGPLYTFVPELLDISDDIIVLLVVVCEVDDPLKPLLTGPAPGPTSD